MPSLVFKICNKAFNSSKERNVKCVFIGDTGVGKTKLISSYIYDKPKIAVKDLRQYCHAPSIIALDLKDSKVLSKLKVSINDIPVNVNVWDTFGCHEKNREYSYKNADVVVICYSIGNTTSLENVTRKWLPEAKFYCPKVPLVLVGTQFDRRHNDKNLYVSKKTKIQSLSDYLNCKPKESISVELVDSESARAVAASLDAVLHMETSIVTKYGVNQLFQNIARVAITKEKRLGKSLPCLLQKPYLPPREIVPVLEVPDISHDTTFFTNVFTHGKKSQLSDVLFAFEDGNVYAESIVLLSGDSLFYELFSQLHDLMTDEYPEKHPDFEYEPSMFNNTPCQLPRGFQQAIHHVCNGQGIIEFKISGISAKVFLQILEFYYTGKIIHLVDSEQVLHTAKYMQLNFVYQFVYNTIIGQTAESIRVKDELFQVILTTGKKIFRINRIWLKDAIFKICADEYIACSKLLVMQRCPVFKAMFQSSNFLESLSNQVDFKDTNVESFLAVLEYLYTGNCEYFGDLHGTLQLANFLCLPRLVALCEREIVQYILDLQETNASEAFEAVLASYNVARIHNAPQLTDWCLHFIATNYNSFCKEQGKCLKLLDEKTQKYLEEHRWPPVWYLKEQDYYERAMQQLEREKLMKKNLKAQKKCRSCCIKIH